jgi:16S rRNA (adenine1518-N6/adenine1519-N6)-dimethyltransferase
LKAKKSYGQHFLNNHQYAERIADSLSLLGERYQKVVEVGPGKGMLTQYLLEKELELIAVEADRDMVSYLQKHYPQLKGHLVNADFLKTDLDALLKGQPFGLIGNFPYNISSQILFKMLSHRSVIPELVGMFQREVAERVIAPPGNKTYGVISVMVQAYYTGEYLFTVKKGNFSPPPKVQSAVIRLVRNDVEKLDCDEKIFRRVVKQAFSQRRKMLRNTMKTFLKGNDLLKDAFFDQRPERLSVQDFVMLAQQVEAHSDGAT